VSEQKTLHLVFNRPPTGLSDEEFNRWALMHFDEVLAVPGWESARRFRLEADVVPDPPIPFGYMSLYELSGDPDTAVSEMHGARYDYPEWFARARAEGCFASWTCVPIGGQVQAQRP
jgi:hypothetical protein